MVHCLARNVFLLYVNDLESHDPLYKYVDDSTLFETCNTTDVSVMQESIDSGVNWTKNNCMKINSNKSKEMVICFKPDDNVLNRALSLMVILSKQSNMQSCSEYPYPLICRGIGLLRQPKECICYIS